MMVLLALMLSGARPAAAADASTGDSVAAEPRDPALVALQRFHSVDPFLGDEDAEATQALARACTSLTDPGCLEYLRRHEALARRAVPDNPAYWSAYDALLGMDLAIRHVGDLEGAPYQTLISTAHDWPLHEILTGGRLDPRRVGAHLTAHRRLLAASRYLIEKVIFIATTGMSLESVNVLMAQSGDHAPAEQRRLVDGMLAPLTMPERSLRRTFEGEYRYGLYVRSRLGDDELASWHQLGGTLEHIRDTYRYVGDRSEASWDDYWRNGVDVVADVPGYNDPTVIPLYGQFTSSVRVLDAEIQVLRALREVYEGSASPGIPGLPAPALWHWRWKTEPAQLCLEPGAVHPSLTDVPAVCAPYLDRDDVAPQPGGIDG